MLERGLLLVVASIAAGAGVAGVAGASRPVATVSRAVAYCAAIPQANITPEEWGFHGGEPITGAAGSYTRGHGTINLAASTATGIICQVDRVHNAPDHQIILSVGRHVLYHSHSATMFGVPGNIMKITVRVTSSTDPACAVGTSGKATIFASYNGVHADSVQYSFPAACRDHRHRYTGPSVVTNVPPN